MNSPKVKIEPAEQLAVWAPVAEVGLPLPAPLPGAARCSFAPGCRCSLCSTIVLDGSDDEIGGAVPAVGRTGGRAGGSGARGGGEVSSC